MSESTKYASSQPSLGATVCSKDCSIRTAIGKIFAFCHDYNIDPATIKFDETTITLLRTPDGRTLADIRSVEDNEFAADQICEIVRELAKEENTRIHALAAGDRKTMSIYITTAMQLFGRAQDRLSHVQIIVRYLRFSQDGLMS
ncbi:MAG: CRISPR-associated ring nuclease Csm6 [Acidobacteria bacterium]|nr:CRISPR-associated ring nuclease Csm6 [Acidobacteriota bacterium]MCI0665419.1 CRISPR-associated ring nuclease Csm6 [Acidobacteriota bacterium]